jgi:hypothetical protein
MTREELVPWIEAHALKYDERFVPKDHHDATMLVAWQLFEAIIYKMAEEEGIVAPEVAAKHFEVKRKRILETAEAFDE